MVRPSGGRSGMQSAARSLGTSVATAASRHTRLSWHIRRRCIWPGRLRSAITLQKKTWPVQIGSGLSPGRGPVVRCASALHASYLLSLWEIPFCGLRVREPASCPDSTVQRCKSSSFSILTLNFIEEHNPGAQAI